MGNPSVEQAAATWQQSVYDDCDERERIMIRHQHNTATLQATGVAILLFLTAIAAATVWLSVRQIGL